MRDLVDRWLRDARKAAAAGATQYCVVCLEAAFAAAGKQRQEEVDSVAAGLVSHAEGFWIRAFEQSDAKLRRARQMLAWPQRLAPEEWLLIITILSGAFALRSFARRFGFERSDSFDAAFDDLKRVTNGFTDESFLSQLSQARYHGYAPLPAFNADGKE